MSPSTAVGAFQRSVTPPLALLIATKLCGASCAERVALLADSEGVALADALGDCEAEGVVATSSEDLFESAKNARTTIPRTTRINGVGELFFAGALGVETAGDLTGADEVATGEFDRDGTGGI